MIEISLLATTLGLTAPPPGDALPPAEGGVAYFAELAIDADFEFYQLHASDPDEVQEAIDAVVGDMQGAFHDAGVTFEIAAVVVRDDADDPYVGDDPAQLFQQAKNEWNTNQPGVEWDAVLILSGKNLSGSVVGISSPSSLCTDSAIALASASGLTEAQLSHVAANQMGRVFGATSCTEATCGVMCPFLNGCGADPLKFGPQALEEIDAFLEDNSGCLEVQPNCAADCNVDGEFTILDFICFQNLFTSGDPAADCNGDDSLNILDFVCFQELFEVCSE